MGVYSEYLNKSLNWPAIEKERKAQLSRIENIRSGRSILVIASDMNKKAPVDINYNDRLPILDQITNIKGDKIDIIIETPGGSAEIYNTPQKSDQCIRCRLWYNSVGKWT